MTDLIIDEEFKGLIPPLTAEERQQLEANILAEGCRDALVVWRSADGDLLLDGHNRYEICREHAIDFQTVLRTFADRPSAIEWVIRNQFGRRNLTPFVRAELELRLEPLIAAKKKAAQVAGGKSKLPQTFAEPDKNRRETRAELGKAAGVSRETIRKTEKILAKASEETKAALRSGETSINAEYKRLTVHVGHNSGENEWYTPPQFIEAARTVMGGIDCDPASSDVANKTVRAKHYFTVSQNGLRYEWDKRVWMNPPYEKALVVQFTKALVEKYLGGEVTEACVLVNNATETAWFQDMLREAKNVCLLAGRVKFHDHTGTPANTPLQGQAVLYYGGNSERFIAEFSKLGHVLCRPTNQQSETANKCSRSRISRGSSTETFCPPISTAS